MHRRTMNDVAYVRIGLRPDTRVVTTCSIDVSKSIRKQPESHSTAQLDGVMPVLCEYIQICSLFDVLDAVAVAAALA